MGFRFRKSFGGLVRLNVTNAGLSISTGVRGARISVPLTGRGRRKARATLSLPGTGLSYTTTLDEAKQNAQQVYQAVAVQQDKPRQLPTPVDGQSSAGILWALWASMLVLIVIIVCLLV